MASHAQDITKEVAKDSKRDSQELIAPSLPPTPYDSATTSQTGVDVEEEQTAPIGRSQSYKLDQAYQSRDLFFIPIPKYLRYDKNNPAHLTLLLNILFGLSSTMTVANLYYVQPLLIDLADAFGLTYSDAANLAVLLQGGYAAGLLLISPCGDMVRRRQLILALLICSIAFSIGLATTRNAKAFQFLCFATGLVTQLPQLLIPLAADLAKPEQRATAISIVMSGLLAGIFIARVLAGIIAQYTSYRNVYWMAVGMQGFILVALYFRLPDFPAKGAGKLRFRDIYWSMGKYALTEPLLQQACLIGMVMSATFAGYWVVLTYLLQGPTYNYNTLQNGLFGIIGLVGVAASPLAGKIIDRLNPWTSQLMGLLLCLLSLAIYAAAAGRHISVVIITTFIFDVGQPMQQIASASRIVGLQPEARGRLNSVFVIFVFIGQIWGTRASASIFLNRGYVLTGVFFTACCAGAILILLARGPNEARYSIVGWRGGLTLRKAKAEKVPDQERDGIQHEMKDESR